MWSREFLRRRAFVKVRIFAVLRAEIVGCNDTSKVAQLENHVAFAASKDSGTALNYSGRFTFAGCLGHHLTVVPARRIEISNVGDIQDHAVINGITIGLHDYGLSNLNLFVLDAEEWKSQSAADRIDFAFDLIEEVDVLEGVAVLQVLLQDTPQFGRVFELGWVTRKPHMEATTRCVFFVDWADPGLSQDQCGRQDSKKLHHDKKLQATETLCDG